MDLARLVDSSSVCWRCSTEDYVRLPKREREATKVTCRIHFGPVPEGIPIILETKEDGEIPGGLELSTLPRNIQPRDYPGPHIMETETFCSNAEQNWAKYMVKSVVPIPNPSDEKDIQEEKKPYSGATPHEDHKQDEWEPPIGLVRRKRTTDCPGRATTRGWCLCKKR